MYQQVNSKKQVCDGIHLHSYVKIKIIKSVKAKSYEHYNFSLKYPAELEERKGKTNGTFISNWNNVLASTEPVIWNLSLYQGIFPNVW